MTGRKQYAKPSPTLGMFLKQHADYLASGRGVRLMAKKHDFTNLDLNEINFSDSVLTGAVFRECSAIGARFIRADAFGADFGRANLMRSDFTNSDLRGSNFQRAL